MNLTIKSLYLEYFKGIIKETVNFKNVTDIYLKNEGGKTTIVDAFIWLFFGKHPEGKTDLDIKTKCTSRTQSHFPDHKIGDVVSNLTHSVIGVIVLDGREIELEKTFKETWGTTAKVKEKHLKTHTTTYSFDKHKCAKSKYESELENIIDEQTFRMLTDPLYFSSDKPRGVHWSERRDIVMKMRGEIDQTKIKGYKEIRDLIGTWGPEEKKQDLKSEIKKIKEEKEKIPTQIEENQRLTIEIPEAGRSIEVLRDEKSIYQEKINQIKSDSGQQELKNKIAAIDTEILEKTNAFNAHKQKRIDILLDSGTSTAQSISSTQNQISELENENSNKQSIVDNNESILNGDRKIFSDIVLEQENLQNENTPVETICPTCKEDLPSDQIETSKQTYNFAKSRKLERMNNALDKIEADGKALKQKTEEFKSEISENLKNIELKKVRLNGYMDSRQHKLHKMELVKKTVANVSSLVGKKSELEKQRDNIKVPDTFHHEQLLACVENEISAINQRSLNIQKNQEYAERISELGKLEVKLSQDQADLENKLSQLENFIVASVESQSELINAMFELATFQMYIKQINSGINNDVCETMLDGVRFNAVNSAGKTQVGIDIIKQLQIFYDRSLPIFVDNRESVTNLPKVECQLINLFVSSQDENMRIEYGK